MLVLAKAQILRVLTLFLKKPVIKTPITLPLALPFSTLLEKKIYKPVNVNLVVNELRFTPCVALKSANFEGRRRERCFNHGKSRRRQPLTDAHLTQMSAKASWSVQSWASQLEGRCHARSLMARSWQMMLSRAKCHDVCWTRDWQEQKYEHE